MLYTKDLIPQSPKGGGGDQKPNLFLSTGCKWSTEKKRAILGDLEVKLNLTIIIHNQTAHVTSIC